MTLLTRPVSVGVSYAKSRGLQEGVKKTAKEFLRKNLELEKDLVELAQNAPKGSKPLDVMISQLKKIGFITDKC